VAAGAEEEDVVAEDAVAAAVHSNLEPFIPCSLLVQWHITDRCDLNCSHCYQGLPQADVPLGDLSAILTQIRELISHIRRMAGGRRIPAHVTITGGEPFLRDDFFTLLERLHAFRREFSFAILSNGSLIDSRVALELSRLKPGFVQLSLEGKKATHDRIRGAGDFDRVALAAASLKKSGIPVLISFTAHRGNFRDFPEVAEMGRRLGASRVWADRFLPLGGAESRFDWVLSPAETREFFEIMRTARTGNGLFRKTEIAMHRALQFHAGGGKPYRCRAGGDLVAIRANGDLCPCRRMPIPVGNVLSSDLVTLYRESRLFAILRDRSIICRGCTGCLYERLCNGGLRCLGHAMTGELHLADPGCWLRDTHRENNTPATTLETL
jgi:radical SAM protein with 4Fe4S-binding SPASM domain